MARLDPSPLFQTLDSAGLRKLGSYFLTSTTVFLLAFDRSGQILQANDCSVRLLQQPPESLLQASIWSLLTEADGRHLQQRLPSPAGSNIDEPFLLNFVDSHHSPLSLVCRLIAQPDCLWLLGERPAGMEEKLSENLLQLNNQLAVLTRENVRKSRALEKALKELKQAQAMLVHQEKMASLGQMTAGVAHEINNPIAYVLSNQETLDRDFSDLLGFVNLVGETLPELAQVAPQIQQRILDHAGVCDLEYLATAIPRKIAASIEGLERVKGIVLDLRTFSRLDEANIKPCDLTENLQSALRFLGPLAGQQQIRLEAALTPLEPLLCAPAALNQAVSNILSNAIQASRPGQTVRISTRAEAGQVVIQIDDQGEGIPPEHLDKICDPFFTTKPVGSGTGLGLSITQQIVTAHGGSLQFDSRPGEGTRVSIRLPKTPATVKQPHSGEVPA